MRYGISNIKHRTAGARGAGSSWNFWLWILRLHPAVVPAFLFLAFSNPSAEAQVSREYELKAVFLYNFAQFTDWPESAFADEKAPIIIGILGADPFVRALEDTVKGETVRGHPLVIGKAGFDRR
jgi:hypothetical protein